MNGNSIQKFKKKTEIQQGIKVQNGKFHSFIFFYFDGLLEDTAASRLYRALHGDRTDVSAVIEILTSHSRQQRNKISKAYKFNHNKVKGRYLSI